MNGSDLQNETSKSLFEKAVSKVGDKLTDMSAAPRCLSFLFYEPELPDEIFE
jgi:cyclic lactone autoinducer peptide